MLDVNHISSGIGAEGLLNKAGLGWITKGSCNAGDVRVSFQARSVPAKGTALVGRQTANGRLVPNKCKAGGSMMLGYPDGSMPLGQMLSTVVSDAKFWANVYRAGILLGFVVTFFVAPAQIDAKGAWFDRDRAGFVILAAWGLVWLAQYGATGALAPFLGLGAFAVWVTQLRGKGDKASDEKKND